MKILLTVHQFLPEFTAGTEILTYSVAKSLLARGHQVRVLTAYPSSDPSLDNEQFDTYDYENIHVHRFHHAYTPNTKQRSLLELSYDNHAAVSFFRSVLTSFSPHIVHAFHLNRLGTGLIDCSVDFGIPTFLTPTDFWSVCNTAQLMLPDGRPCTGPSTHAGNCIQHLAEIKLTGYLQTIAKKLPKACFEIMGYLANKQLLPAISYGREVCALRHRLAININRLNRLSKIVVPNQMMRNVLIRHGVDENRLIEKAYGVDLGNVGTVFPRNSTHKPLNIGYIGTLAPHKGCHILIKAFNTLPQGCANLVIYGNFMDFPDYSAELRQLSGDHPHIRFAGMFVNDRIFDVLADIDILVIPSLWQENSPLVLYTAQAAKCPVIVSDFPGLTAYVEHDHNGLIFKAGEIETLTRLLKRVIQDETLIGRLSANAKVPKSAENYTDDLLSIWGTA